MAFQLNLNLIIMKTSILNDRFHYKRFVIQALTIVFTVVSSFSYSQAQVKEQNQLPEGLKEKYSSWQIMNRQA